MDVAVEGEVSGCMRHSGGCGGSGACKVAGCGGCVCEGGVCGVWCVGVCVCVCVCGVWCVGGRWGCGVVCGGWGGCGWVGGVRCGGVFRGVERVVSCVRVGGGGV